MSRRQVGDIAERNQLYNEDSVFDTTKWSDSKDRNGNHHVVDDKFDNDLITLVRLFM